MNDPIQTRESPEVFDREALAEDARALVEFIESIHPDPYIGYDGRVALHTRLERIIKNLPESATLEEFYRYVAPLVAGLEDSHSLLLPPQYETSTEEGVDTCRMPISFRVIGESLYVDAVFDESLADLVGTRLLAIESTPVKELATRSVEFYGVENRYFGLSLTGQLLRKPLWLARLLDRQDEVSELSMQVQCDDGKKSVQVTPAPTEQQATHELTESFPHPMGTGPRFRLYDNAETAVFVPGNLSDYRESLEVALHRGAERVEDLAPDAYKRQVDENPPDDVADTVAALPSMMEALTELVDTMAAAETQTLIVDLRDNPGGDSQFVLHLAYVLQGWEGVMRVREQTRSLKRRTELHRNRYGTFGEGNDDLGTAIENPAQYDFSEFLDAYEDEANERRSRVETFLTNSKTFATITEDGSYEAACNPDQLIVAVSAGTMSSGFAGAAQLASLGAELVGVPSGQAPRSFGEAVQRTLPNTELSVSIAGSLFHWIPDPDSNVLELDCELTPDLFTQYGKAADAGLRLAFDYANTTDPSRSPPQPVDIE